MGIKLSDLDPAFRKLAEEALAAQDRAAIPAANVERPVKHGPVDSKTRKKLDSPMRVRVVCRRKRLCDLDNLSCKAVLDGLVTEGFIEDDSAQFIRHLEVSQEKCQEDQPEQTTIEFYADDGVLNKEGDEQ